MKATQARIGYVILAAGALLFWGKAEASGQLRSAAKGMTQQQGQMQGQAQLATGGNTLTEVDNDTDMPASSAISPSVGTANDCQIATPSSKAMSVFVFSASGTTGVTYNDLCFAYKTGQYDVAEKLMCKYSKNYAEANPSCGANQ